MRLTVGTPAPALVADTLDGRRVDLAGLRGRTVHVKFYRFATCPVCNLHLQHFIKDYRLVEALGLTTFVVFHSPAAKLEAGRRDDVPFDLIADPDKAIFRAFGVETGLAGMLSPAVLRDYMRALAAGFPSGMLTSDGGLTGNPADFIVDAGGLIAFAHYGKHYSDSLTAAQIADVRRGLESGRAHIDAPVMQHA